MYLKVCSRYEQRMVEGISAMYCEEMISWTSMGFGLFIIKGTSLGMPFFDLVSSICCTCQPWLFIWNKFYKVTSKNHNSIKQILK